MALDASASSGLPLPSTVPSSAPALPVGLPPLSAALVDHLVVMVDLQRARPLSQVELVAELKACREAYKKVRAEGR